MGLLEKRIMMIKPLRLKLKKPSITGLATTIALNAVKTNIPNVSDLVKKTNYDAKISALRVNISPHLIIINLQAKYLMQSKRKGVG